jgi:5'-nucleotidase
MRILLTNDDGIHAPGLAALAEAASGLGEVWVVAPVAERSGVSHALSLAHPVRLEEIRPRWYACDGTPGDSTYMALHYLKVAPDLVLSGLNPGPNLAHDLLYSGTVAAAVEASHWGVPAMALSHASARRDLLPEAGRRLRAVLDRLWPLALAHRLALNVNLPAVDRGEWRGLRVTRAGLRWYSTEVYERKDPRGRPYLWVGGQDVSMPPLEGSDCDAVRDGWVSVTPIGDDLTRHDQVPLLAAALVAGAGSVLGAGT